MAGVVVHTDENALAASIARQVGPWFQTRLDVCADAARADAPRGNGDGPHIADNIGVRDDTVGLRFQARLVANVSHALAVHEGARPHQILPRRPGGVLRWQTAGGEVVFRRRVDNHPGNPPNPFLRNAVVRIVGGG